MQPTLLEWRNGRRAWFRTMSTSVGGGSSPLSSTRIVNAFMNFSVQKAKPLSKDHWSYVFLVATHFNPMWALGVLVLPLRKDSELIVCKLDQKTMGGFILCDLPLNIRAKGNFFSRKRRQIFQNLIRNGYRYLMCVVIAKKQQGKGYGKMLLKEARKQFNTKSYLKPKSLNLKEFYESVGAVVYKTQNDGEIQDGGLPIMIFNSK